MTKTQTPWSTICTYLQKQIKGNKIERKYTVSAHQHK